eukprot:1144103-Pelagomonas_calceolata.AAC.2
MEHGEQLGASSTLFSYNFWRWQHTHMPSLCVASFDTGVKIHEPPMLLLQFLCLQRQCMTIVRTMRVLQLHCLHGQCMTIMKTMRAVHDIHCDCAHHEHAEWINITSSACRRSASITSGAQMVHQGSAWSSISGWQAGRQQQLEPAPAPLQRVRVGFSDNLNVGFSDNLSRQEHPGDKSILVTGTWEGYAQPRVAHQDAGECHMKCIEVVESAT